MNDLIQAAISNVACSTDEKGLQVLPSFATKLRAHLTASDACKRLENEVSGKRLPDKAFTANIRRRVR